MTLGQIYFLLSATKGSFKQYSIEFLKNQVFTYRNAKKKKKL